MSKWGIYNNASDFFNNLQINDKIKYNKGDCICEGEIISIDKPLKKCKVLKLTKKTINNQDIPLKQNEKILILPNQAINCEVI